ncbi:MAG: nucleotidyltransferase domain-containing protein [Butyrivibrio sp.]|nr:nucleotidyltransferase domain-containing protein [Butyrivibrio sp.]
MKKLRNMSTDLKKIYGAYLQTVILYGSYARGEQTDESDIDIAIVLKKGNTESMHDSMIDTVVDYELDIAKTLSIVPIDYENYQEWRKVLPFYKNIDKEGIIIWKAA